jgi:hypothetical protein
MVMQLCHGVVVAVKKQNRVHIEWSDICIREGDLNDSEETLMKSKYKHIEGGW